MPGGQVGRGGGGGAGGGKHTQLYIIINIIRIQ